MYRMHCRGRPHLRADGMDCQLLPTLRPGTPAPGPVSLGQCKGTQGVAALCMATVRNPGRPAAAASAAVARLAMICSCRGGPRHRVVARAQEPAGSSAGSSSSEGLERIVFLDNGDAICLSSRSGGLHSLTNA